MGIHNVHHNNNPEGKQRKASGRVGHFNTHYGGKALQFSLGGRKSKKQGQYTGTHKREASEKFLGTKTVLQNRQGPARGRGVGA